MRRTSPVVLALALSGTMAGGRASASEAVERERPNAVDGILGVGTPVGFVGVEVGRLLVPSLELTAGVGVGGSASGSSPKTSLGHDLQWSFMPRIRVARGRHAVTFGVGISGGQYGGIHLIGNDDNPDNLYPTLYTFWLNAEIGGEYRSHDGFLFRYFVGGAAGYPLTQPGSYMKVYYLPYTGVGVGYAF
jgi:hypothetical protein